MISIIIPTYNEEGNIEKVLSQLKMQLARGDEVLIVDSSSKDNTAKIAKSFGAKVISTGKEGIGIARTTGAKNSSNDIIAFLDADCDLSPNWLEKLRHHFSDSSMEAVGGLDLYRYDNFIEDVLYNTYSRLIFLSSIVMHKAIGNFWVPGNNGAFRKDVFIAHGGYRCFLVEDGEFTKRFKPKKAVNDMSLRVVLSDRRFKTSGFFMTVILWTKGNIEAFIGKENRRKAVKYRK